MLSWYEKRQNGFLTLLPVADAEKPTVYYMINPARLPISRLGGALDTLSSGAIFWSG